MTGDQARKSDVHIPLRSTVASASPEIAWPVVEFIRPKHATGPYYSKTLIAQMSVEIKNAQTTLEAERHQVPLILAWQVTPRMMYVHVWDADFGRALTIHKSQGQTIERVRIDVKKVFVEGMKVPFEPR
jgi:ATP-dependent DNA helicase PIF1